MSEFTLLDWSIGSSLQFNNIQQNSHQGLICRPVAPLSTWSRNIDYAVNRQLVDPGNGDRYRFQRMSNTDRLGIAVKGAASSLPGEFRDKIIELAQPGNIAIMAGGLAIWIGAHATPVGWIVDIGMVGLGVVALGAEAFNVTMEIKYFAQGIIDAGSENELMDAGKHLSKAIAIVGVDVVIAILLKKATIKIREPRMKQIDAEVSQNRLFGKYDPKTAQTHLKPDPKKPAAAVAMETIASKRKLANDYYKKLGWPDERIDSHLAGIDFSKPVELVNIPKGTKLVQYQIPGSPTGKYFAPPGTAPETIGVNPAGRTPLIYETTQDVTVLKSVAADTSMDMSLPALARGAGGGTQYFTTDTSAFVVAGH
jgi:hypothetical protein